MAKRTSEVLLQYKVAGDDKVISSVNTVDGAYERLTKRLGMTTGAFDRVSQKQAEVKRTNDVLNDSLKSIQRDSQVDALGEKYGKLAAKLQDSGAAARQLARELREIGATKAEIEQAAAQFERFRADGVAAGGGKSAGGTFGLKSFGRELKNLPAVAIPGLGISTDAIGKITQLLGNLNPAALAAGGAVGILAGALVLLTQRAQQTAQAARAEIDARSAALRLLEQGNKQEIQARINQLAEQRRINEIVANDANQLLVNLREGILKDEGPLRAAQAEFNALVGTGAGELIAAKQAAEAANAELAKTNNELNILQQGSGLTAQATRDLAQAENLLRLERLRTNDLIRASQNELSAEIEKYGLIESGTSEALNKRLESLREERNLVNAAIQDLSRKRDLEVAGSEAQKLLNEQILNFADRADALSDTLKVLADPAVASAIRAREAEEQLAAERQRRIDESISAVQKYNNDVATLNNRLFEQSAAIEQKRTETLVRLAEQAAEAAEQALSKLQEQQAKLAQDLARNEEDAERKRQFNLLEQQIKYQAQEAKDARDHANKLVDIRKKAAEREQDLIANRDFAGLFRARRDTNTQLEETTAQYNEQREQRLAALKAESEDKQRQFIFDQQQRQINYRRALSDAQAQYNRELALAAQKLRAQTTLAEQAYRADLTMLGQKYNAELSLRQQAIQAELQLIQQGNSAKLLAEQQLLAQAAMLRNGVFNSPAVPTAVASVSNSSMSNTFNIRGANADNIAATVLRTMKAVLVN